MSAIYSLNRVRTGCFAAVRTCLYSPNRPHAMLILWCMVISWLPSPATSAPRYKRNTHSLTPHSLFEWLVEYAGVFQLLLAGWCGLLQNLSCLSAFFFSVPYTTGLCEQRVHDWLGRFCHIFRKQIWSFSGGKSVMSFSFVSDILGWIMKCCVLVFGSEMIYLPGSLHGCRGW